MAQGWNFGEVILSAINAQEERNARMAMLRRSQEFEKAENVLNREQQLAVLRTQADYQKELQGMRERGETERMREQGKQRMEELVKSGALQKENSLLNQQPVSAAQLEEAFKGTALQGKFLAAANKDGMVTFNDRQLIMGMQSRADELAMQDRHFKDQMTAAQNRWGAEMDYMKGQNRRDWAVANEAIQAAQDPKVQPVPTRTGEGWRGLNTILGGVAAATGSHAGWITSIVGNAQTANQNTMADSVEASNELAIQAAAKRQLKLYDIYAKNSELGLTPTTAAANAIMAPDLQTLPPGPVQNFGAGVLQWSQSPLIQARLKYQAALEEQALQNKGALERAQVSK